MVGSDKTATTKGEKKEIHTAAGPPQILHLHSECVSFSLQALPVTGIPKIQCDYAKERTGAGAGWGLQKPKKLLTLRH